MYRVISLIIILIPFIAVSQINQKDSNGFRQGKWQKSHPNGRLSYQGYFKDDKPVGEWIRYYESGQVKARIKYINSSDSADAELFDPYGKKMAEGSYLNEKREGLWQFFSENIKVSEEEYKDGKKHGISRRFYPTGEILDMSEWRNGIQEGDYSIFFKSGKPYMQCKYRNGKRNGICIAYQETGSIEMEAYYSNNLRDGEWKYYDKNGISSYILKYSNGKLLNPEVVDSINSILQNQFQKESVADPEDYIQDPSGYMIQMQKNR